MDNIGYIFDLIILNPMLNGLIVLYRLLFNNFALAILVFTVLVRVLMLPLTLRQLRVSKAMSALQPKLAEIQQRYGKDRQRVSQETMKLYREYGINPLGCAGPMLIQFPIWIALYSAIIRALAASPADLAQLAKNLYPYPWLQEAIPLNSDFLGILNLAYPDPTKLVLPLLVGASTWVQQRMSMLPSADPRTQATNQMMQIMMPLMFYFFTMGFPSGLALYWLASNLISIVMQYFVTGWGGLFGSQAISVASSASIAKEEPITDKASTTSTGKRPSNARSRGKRKVGR